MRLRDLAADLADGFRSKALDGATVYFGGPRAGLTSATAIARDALASLLIRCAYHAADGAILLQRITTEPGIPRNVAVAVGADALTYGALDQVGADNPALYGPEDAGYWPAWRDREPPP